ncbi:MAG: PrsW family intramembrane metalloprotease [Pseudolabrys sp.]
MTLIEFLPSTIGAAACLPAILLLWLVVIADRRPEPPLRVLAALLGGVASIFLARLLRFPFDDIASASGHLPLYVMFGVSIPEETAKISIIALFALNRRLCDEPMDGAVFGAAVGLGFAAYENLGYLTGFGEHWLALAVVRNALTVPFHGALGVIAGGYLARLRFGKAIGTPRRSRAANARLALFAWFIPVVLHTLFDTTLFSMPVPGSGTRLVLLALAGLVIGGGTTAIAVRQVLKLSRHQKSLRSRAPMRAWRAVWAFIFAGGFAGFAGAALLARALLNGIAQEWPDAVLGAVLLAAALAAFHWSARHLLKATPAAPA